MNKEEDVSRGDFGWEFGCARDVGSRTLTLGRFVNGHIFEFVLEQDERGQQGNRHRVILQVLNW